MKTINDGVGMWGRPKTDKFWIGDRNFTLRKDVGMMCKELGITKEEILQIHRQYNKFGVPATYNDASVHAILKRKQNAK